MISGATVEQVANTGPVTTYGQNVTTYGQNDMVLDNWGEVTSWTATASVTSHGPSGIGFVNFRRHRRPGRAGADPHHRQGRAWVQPL